MNGYAANRRASLLKVYAALVFIFIYLPVVVLILYSFNRDGVFLPDTSRSIGTASFSATPLSGMRWLTA
jgi:ABC-type spermidine/putrescine transport system permease subunit II